MSFGLEFWGVRGSIACPSPQHVRYGGNTSCIQVTVGEQQLVLDAGTGIRSLGHSFLKQDVRHAHILITHTHWDHINGFPFFTPAFQKERRFEILAGHLKDQGGRIEEVIAGQMAQPTFPVPLETMEADLAFEDFSAGDRFSIPGGVSIATAKLNHPNGATGYRIEYGGKALCYVTDTEHVPGKPDQNVLGLIAGADLVIYDSTYTDDEFAAKVGWGHSTWQEAVRLCQAAEVKKLVIFHHDPDHEDDFMEAIEQQAMKAWPAAFVAREGMKVEVG
jgi:phosphoribosyl 1,2-cyclic phosphodiesterase